MEAEKKIKLLNQIEKLKGVLDVFQNQSDTIVIYDAVKFLLLVRDNHNNLVVE